VPSWTAWVRQVYKHQKFPYDFQGPYYAGPVPEDYQTQIEEKIDQAIIREIIQERKKSRAA
jgi:hypothetical protein